jgi:hypothetical protein
MLELKEIVIIRDGVDTTGEEACSSVQWSPRRGMCQEILEIQERFDLEIER